MSWFNRQTFATHIAISLVAGFLVGVSAEVLADTVYKWTTEDGTIAYTDDQKHIPARYRDQVETQQMKRLSGYERYTPLGRQGGLPEAGGVAVAPTHTTETIIVDGGGQGMSVMTGGTRFGQNGMIVPVESPMATASAEPVVIENRRVQRSDSMATSHETVVRQGDRIISINRDEPNQRETGMVPPLDPPL
jgi:hypothetical protein